MSFKDLKLKPTYNSAHDDIINEFYVPILSEAIKYDRIVGFFNSYSLALIVDGLKEFISNGGKIRLLCGAQLDKEDEYAILNSSKIAELLSNNFLKELDSISDDIQLNRIKILAWLVENNILEIKIGIVKDSYGFIGGILHEKTGIIKDCEDNIIVFSGSNNATGAGLSSFGLGNLEKFKVFLSWEDYKFMNEDIDEFNTYWDNSNPHLEVIDIPIAAKKGLIKYAPENLEELMTLNINYESIYKHKDERELRDYQEKAISSWINHDKKGIFEMATGTGKTFTAMNCIREVIENYSRVLIVIACPYAHLVQQWAKDVRRNFNIGCYDIYSSVNPTWKKEFTDLIFNLDLNITKQAIIFTTHKTYSSDFFLKEISKLDILSFLIVDEMHHIISERYREGLIDFYDFRLGLSATPKSPFNEEGNDFVFDYFGDIIFKFGLDDALIECDPDGKTYLAHYNYFPKKVQLDSEELNDYMYFTNKINQLMQYDDVNEDTLDHYIRLRRDIIRNAKSKYVCLKEIINSYNNDLDHLIIFCSNKQIDNVLRILKEEGVSPSHRFTYREKNKPEKRFNNLSHREYLVEEFDKGYFKALVAIKCLDEGVDIPSAKKVIIMASSTNPGEYIQRRGRVLRRHKDKEKAEIYDMAVIEYDSQGNPIESIVNNELNRLNDFIESSDNPNECLELLKKWRV